MSDSYQAIYDAVRSKISGGNLSDVVRDVAFEAFDISHMKACLLQDFSASAYEQRRPFVLLRPVIKRDGNQWCALYGESIQEGVAGFGDTPEKAAQAFDLAWLNEKP